MPTSRRHAWQLIARRNPSALLLAAQLVSLLLYPVLDSSHTGRTVFGGISVSFVLLTLWVVNRSASVTWVGWMLAAPALVLAVAAVVTENDSVLAVSSAFEAALYFYAAGGLIVYMLHDHMVTSDELFAAGASFTLLAWGFAYAYLVCQALYPGSFAGAVDPERPRTWLELLFLSFSTLSAVGLGDVIPLLPQARVLVMIEMLCGVAYIAVVVSRLIGLTLLRDRSG